MDYSPRYGRFRALLRQIRVEAGLSQAQLAEQIGKPQTLISKSELGERRTDGVELLDICAACRIPIEQFAQRFSESTAEAAPRKKRRSPRKMDSEGRVTD